MRVLAWTALGYADPLVTGVGKHIVHMLNGLARRDGWDVSLLIASDDCKSNTASRNSSPIGQIPFLRWPMNRRVSEAFWRTLGSPAITGSYGGPDWLYCPRELYVPVKGMRYAITVHDVYRGETNGSGSGFRFGYQRAFRRALETATLV